MLLYNLQIKFFQIVEYFQYKHCYTCDEIIFDDYCDFCDNH